MIAGAQHLRSVVTQDGAVILDTQRGEMWNLNPSGAFIWKAVLDGRPPEQIAAELAAQTGDDVQSATNYVDEFLNELQAKHLYRPQLEPAGEA
jgi:hypothetical protein